MRAPYYFFFFRGKSAQAYPRTQAYPGKTPLGNGLKQAGKIFQKEAKSLNFYSYYFFRFPLRRLRI